MTFVVKKLALLAAAISFLVLAIGGTFLVLGMRQRARAQTFLNDATSLRLGEATFADTQRLASRYGGKPWNDSVEGKACTWEKCYLFFDFPNPRNHLHFAYVPAAALSGILYVKDDRVVGIEVVYQRESNNGRAAYGVDDFLLKAPPINLQMYRWVSPGYSVMKLKADRNGLPSLVEVRLNDQSTQDERRRAYSLDLSCLTVFGCTPDTIFPSGTR